MGDAKFSSLNFKISYASTKTFNGKTSCSQHTIGMNNLISKLRVFVATYSDMTTTLYTLSVLVEFIFALIANIEHYFFILEK